MSAVHFWNGTRQTDSSIHELFNETLKEAQNNSQNWIKAPLDQHILYSALRAMKSFLLADQNFYSELLLSLMERPDFSQEEAKMEMQSLMDFIEVSELRKKVKREFHTEHPFELKRIDGRENAFEAHYPLGAIVHITPSNAPLLCVLSVIEGLLSGNINLLKLGRKDGAFAALFFEKLCALDHYNELSKYIFIIKISSKETQKLKDLISLGDAISVWGGEESVASIKAMVPRGVRIIEWGHKISFSYFSKKKSIDVVEINKLAHEICQNDQMACSSPQCVYLEDASFLELKAFGEKLLVELKVVSPLYKAMTPSVEESAEITVNTELIKLKSISEEAELLIDESGAYRIYIENNSVLTPSPLYRTIWIKPMPKAEIVKNLRPIGLYLQTVGVSCLPQEINELSDIFFRAGLLRVRPVGEMLSSYAGEPHDGELALLRFTKKINFYESENQLMNHKYSFESHGQKRLQLKTKIMEKNDFQNQKVEERYCDLYFYSGGSSGKPKLSVFTYDDYHRQMEVAAEGLFAAGLDPKVDRTMNLFYAGNLYGGFTSFFTILEKLNAVQFPMGGSTDFEMVGRTIVDNKVDTLLGMPSYLIELFRHNSALFKEHKIIKKIFFGGEHFSQGQRDFLMKEYGVTFIRAASYGSVDAGPLAFQCPYSEGKYYHLYEKLHELEIVELEEDAPVKSGDIGRLLFSSKVRHGQQINRYAIGDIGREVQEECACLRSGVRFELLGRHGDVFRIGTAFLSYQRIEKILIDSFDFTGQMQIHLFDRDENSKEKLQILLYSEKPFKDEQKIYQILLFKYQDLQMVVNEDLVLELEVKIVDVDELSFNDNTKKLKSVIDHR